MTTVHTPRTLWDAVVGIAAALLVFCAVPGVLIGLVGLPAPHRWTEHALVSWHGLFDLLAVLSWCAWVGCAWPILRSAAARVRSGDVGAAARLSDRIAVRIALGVLAMSSFVGLGASAAGASSAGAWVAGASSAIASSPAGPSSLPSPLSRAGPERAGPERAGPGRAGPGRAAPGRLGPEPVDPDRIEQREPAVTWAGESPVAVEPRSCVVEPGSTLASLAAAHYGDASDWPAIAAANLGRLMDDETRFVDPSVVSPGWTLALPALDVGTRTECGAAMPADPGHVVGGSATEVLTDSDPLTSAGSALPLAELAAAGVSALVAALLARRARQLRRLRAFLREEGDESPEPHEREAGLGALLAPFERIPLVDMVEVAARVLGTAIATLDPAPGAVQWLRAGMDGVEVRFSEPVPERIAGWRRTGNETWLLPAAADLAELRRALQRGDPWCAALLPLGDDDRGTWLLPLEAGSCVAVVGPRAVDLVLALRAAVRSWSWHEELVVTDRVDEADHAVGRAVPSPIDRSSGPQVLFVGDPHRLSPSTRRACAVLTTRHVDDAEVTIVVDDRAASAHPLGLTVRPALLDPSWRGAVDALIDTDPGGVAATPRDERHLRDEPHRRDERPSQERPRQERPRGPSGEPDTRGTTRPPGPTRTLVRRRTSPATVRVTEHDAGSDATSPDLFSWAGTSARGGHGPETSAARPRGGAEVRLLAAVPGIVGLQAELPVKRARRAVELVAYLAMHAPDPVTGDRLRTRVLGSADSDAAAKTLFNTVGAARRALGLAPDGEPLFPPASRSGHYRLSPLVTVDALCACALIREGMASHDPVDSAARLHEGLELVKGEPLGGVLTGYAWWRAEGHERRLADAVVDGACALVRAALDAGDLDRARWALAQARAVEPYSESLTRSAMRVAAASGDARRLHAEWRECQRQVDELDPGGMPSERTERLYAMLRAQLAGAAAVPGQASFAAIDAAPFRTVPSAPSTV